MRSREWLEHRFWLFELYCLPSIKNQTCRDFTWIVLFDCATPNSFKERIAVWQKECPQFVPIYVEPKRGWEYARIFREEVICRLPTQEFRGRVLTTYLDNDDMLSICFVDDLQHRVQSLSDGTFLYYTEGYQLFTDHKYLMKIYYPRNHFVSVVESEDPTRVKTIYGYGSHYYIDKIKGAKIEYVKDLPMWCQVIHEKNMGNDAYFLRAKMIYQKSLLITIFGLQEEVKYSVGMYLFRFLPRYVKTFVRRCMIKLRGYRFE